MAIPFDKRRIYRALLRPYRKLDHTHRHPSGSHVRGLPGTEVPGDEHYLYAVYLVEIDSGLSEPSSCHTVLTTIQGKPAVVAYIVVNRSHFGDDPLQRTTRLLYISHELLFVTQYPEIVRRHAGFIHGAQLRDEVTLPNPDVELDLVCSFGSIARCLRTLKQVRGIHVETPAQLQEMHKAEQGVQHLEQFWVEDRGIAPEIYYDKVREFLELGLSRPGEDLVATYEDCKELGKADCPSPDGEAKQCVGCPRFDYFVGLFRARKKHHLSIDRELCVFLCENSAS